VKLVPGTVLPPRKPGLAPTIVRESKANRVLPKPISRKAWPDWVKNFADAHASDDDKGFGDTVERVIGDFASAKFKAWYLTLTGKACGCDGRKRKWNAIYPYVTSSRQSEPAGPQSIQA
jgi:hypothetical protein